MVSIVVISSYLKILVAAQRPIQDTCILLTVLLRYKRQDTGPFTRSWSQAPRIDMDKYLTRRQDGPMAKAVATAAQSYKLRHSPPLPSLSSILSLSVGIRRRRFSPLLLLLLLLPRCWVDSNIDQPRSGPSLRGSPTSTQAFFFFLLHCLQGRAPSSISRVGKAS